MLPAVTAARVGYLGPAGTFTEEALTVSLEQVALEPVAYPSIEDALAAAANGEVDFAFVPIENALEGSVLTTLDALIHRYDLLAIAESILAIHHVLLGYGEPDLARVREVRSHPQALAQSQRYLRAQLPQADLVAVASTADAARQVRLLEDPTVAAIAPRRAAALWGLKVLAESIEDDPHNETRFWLLARDRLPPPTGNDRTALVCFQVVDRPGSLLSLLVPFASRGINLTKLESRPARTNLGAYLFVIELEGHVTDESVAGALEDLRELKVRTKLLGSFEAARPPTAHPRRPPTLLVSIDPGLPRTTPSSE